MRPIPRQILVRADKYRPERECTEQDASSFPSYFSFIGVWLRHRIDPLPRGLREPRKKIGQNLGFVLAPGVHVTPLVVGFWAGQCPVPASTLAFDAFGPIGFVMKFAADDWGS